MKLTDLMPDIYTLIPYSYDIIQNDVFDSIIEQELSRAQPATTPFFHQISGIPGSGKSTFCEHFLHKNPSFSYISFDKIMESIPSYSQDIIKKGSAEAFKNWEIPARIIGYEILKRLIEKKANILLEHSGVNEPHLHLCKNIKQLSYTTTICFLMCDKKIALKRTKERECLTHRHTPESLIEQRALSIVQYAQKYTKIADKIECWDTSKDKLAQIKLF